MQRDEQRRKAARVTDDSFAALTRAFMQSPKFTGYSAGTQKRWGIELNFASRPDCLGTLSLQEIRPSLVQAFFDGISDRPGKQASALTALRELEKWAIVRDILPRQITLGVEIEDSDGGHIPWTPEQVALAELHARPDLARVVTLGAHTGQRISDLVRLGPTDIEIFNGQPGFALVQVKTKRQVWVPITSPLAAAMEGWEKRPGPYLLRPDGQPWRPAQLSDTWGHHRDINPALEPLRAIGPTRDQPARLHGLRGHACVVLLRAGANTRQISDMVGMSEPIVARYTRHSLQKENASAAVYHLERTLRERNSIIRAKGDN